MRSLLRGVITAADDDHPFVVQVQQGEESWVVVADAIVTSDTPLRLRPGDCVLCLVENDDRQQ